jgi:DNA polymerase III epsilon subunit-like protein
MSESREIFVSVDIETAGPIPGEFSLLSIGACVVDNVAETFACQLQPINRNADPDALKVAGLSLESLAKTGLSPLDAMTKFAGWADTLVRKGDTLVFVGFNAPFDWSFVNYYFHRFLGRNPFGFTALDIKAYYLGVSGCMWSDTRSSRIAASLQPRTQGDHTALHDALYQAELFRLTRDLRSRINGVNRASP